MSQPQTDVDQMIKELSADLGVERFAAFLVAPADAVVVPPEVISDRHSFQQGSEAMKLKAIELLKEHCVIRK